MSASPTAPPIWLLFVLVYVGQLAGLIYLPGIPGIAADLDTSLSAAQSLVGVYFLSLALNQLIMGPLSDRFGRRATVLGGLILFTVASGACVFVPDITTFYVLRAAQATGACATIAVGRAIVRDTTEGVDTARRLAWLASAIALGPATAPFLGGFLTAWFGWQSTFVATAAIGATVLALVFANLKETLPADSRRPPRVSRLLTNYLELTRNRTLIGYTAIITFASGSMTSFITATPVVMLVLLDVSPEYYGFLLVLMSVIFMIGNQVARLLTYRITVNQIILIGACFSVLGGALQLGLALAGVMTANSVFLAAFVSNIGTGLISANCYAKSLGAVPVTIGGQAAALSGCLHMGWSAAMAFLVSQMHHTSSLQLGIAQMGTTLLTFLLAVVVIVIGWGRSTE